MYIDFLKVFMRIWCVGMYIYDEYLWCTSDIYVYVYLICYTYIYHISIHMRYIPNTRVYHAYIIV